jgi:alpha-L-rhamnosidase
MRKYLDEWVPRWTGKDGDAYAHTLTSGLGDWLPPAGVPTINALVSTAFYARMAHIAADTARALGDAGGAAKYDALFAAVRADFNARFLARDGVYREKPADGFVQTAQVLPIAFGLVPDAERAAVADRLASDILAKRGGHAYVGVIGAAYVLPALTATGHHDVAVTVATKTDEPSWGYWTDTLRFTSLGESWPADTRSRNHHFFGAIVQWMFEDLAGIRALEPGYALVEFKPELPSSGIDEVSASYESVRGPVAIAWKRTPQGLGVRITVPANARGRVYVPADDPGAITEQGAGVPVPIGSAEGVAVAGASAGRVRLDVGSGTYVFVVGRSPFEDRAVPVAGAR